MEENNIQQLNKISTEDLKNILLICFENGATEEEACAYANIDISELEKIEKEDASFITKKNNTRHKINLKAKNIIIKKMNKNDDHKKDLRFLELKRKDAELKNNKKNNNKWRWIV